MRQYKYRQRIIKSQEGSSTSGWIDLATSMIPIYGTYKEGKRFLENPSWSNAGSFGLSLAGDIGTVFGAGLITKGLSAANKARKFSKAAQAVSTASNELLPQIYKTNKLIKRGNDAVTSLTLQDAPTTAIMSRVRNTNALKDQGRTLMNNYNSMINEATDLYRKSSNYRDASKIYKPGVALMSTRPLFGAPTVAIHELE